MMNVNGLFNSKMVVTENLSFAILLWTLIFIPAFLLFFWLLHVLHYGYTLWKPNHD